MLDAAAQIHEFVIQNLLVAFVDLAYRRVQFALQSKSGLALDQARAKRALVAGEIDDLLPAAGVAGGVNDCC